MGLVSIPRLVLTMFEIYVQSALQGATTICIASEAS